MIEAPKAAPITIKSNDITEIIQQFPTTQAITTLGYWIAQIGTVHKQLKNTQRNQPNTLQKVTTSYLTNTKAAMTHNIVFMKNSGASFQLQH